MRKGLRTTVGAYGRLMGVCPSAALTSHTFVRVNGTEVRNTGSSMGTVHSTVRICSTVLGLPTSPLGTRTRFHVNRTVRESTHVATITNHGPSFSSTVITCGHYTRTCPRSTCTNSSFGGMISCCVSVESCDHYVRALRHMFRSCPSTP